MEPGSIEWVEPGSIEWVEPGSIEWVEPGSIEWVEPGSKEWVEPGSIEWVEPGSIEWVEPGNEANNQHTQTVRWERHMCTRSCARQTSQAGQEFTVLHMPADSYTTFY